MESIITDLVCLAPKYTKAVLCDRGPQMLTETPFFPLRNVTLPQMKQKDTPVNLCKPCILGHSSLSLRLSSLGRSLPIAPNHHHAQEASDHSAAKEKEDDRDANGPDAGREEGLDEVRVVDEGLF